jgi:hypothetical protein
MRSSALNDRGVGEVDTLRIWTDDDSVISGEVFAALILATIWKWGKIEASEATNSQDAK